MGIDISNEEFVVRILLSVSKDGIILPSSFKLREWPEPKGPERYISVNRYDSPALVSDLLSFDKGRNLPCAKMNVGEIRNISLFLGATDDYPVHYEVRDMQSDTIPSHAGIFITIGGKPLEGSGVDLLNAIEEGKEKEANLMAIRRKLVDIASKSKTSVDTLCSQKDSETNTTE